MDHVMDASSAPLRLRAPVFCCVSALVLFGCSSKRQDTDPQPSVSQAYAVELTAKNAGGLPKCDSKSAGTTAFVLSPEGLWSCQ